jgi:membrane protein DedA with SNARE-associated domain
MPIHLHLGHLLTQYGYLALFIGCLLEGETLLILAGYAAHRGYLSFPLVVMLAAIAGALGDQIFFFLGRIYGIRVIRHFPDAKVRVARFNHRLLRYHRRLIVAVRFMYGLRVLGPIIIGNNDEVPTRRFIVYNLLGAILWAGVFAGVGYLFGPGMRKLIADIRQYEALAAGLLLLVVLLWWARYRYRNKAK